MAIRRFEDGWNGLFRSFDDEFDIMREQMDRLMGSAMSGIGTDPLIYGFSMDMGADGRPMVREFGDLPRNETLQMDPGRREPLTDIIEEEDRVKVIIEMPGVDREDIDLRSESRELSISVNTERKKFNRRLDLPCDVRSDSATAEYKNGVLTVLIEKVPEADRGHKITIN